MESIESSWLSGVDGAKPGIGFIYETIDGGTEVVELLSSSLPP